MNTEYGRNNAKSTVANFTWSKKSMTSLGFILGIALIVLAVTIDILSKNLHFDLAAIKTIYEQNVTHWIILTSPFVLSAVFFVMGKMLSDHENVVRAQLREEKEQSFILENFISQLQADNFDVHLSDTFKNKEVAARLSTFKEKLASEKSREEKRSWENQGLASFGDLLRREADTENLSFQALRFLVKYLDCNQGSVFLVDGSSEWLEMKACYAYDKKKFSAKAIPIGEGLVGQCFVERETILLYEVPKDYIKITSGLGLATPDCILIVPLKRNDTVVGVIEVASFNRLEKHQILFLEKCSEAFASVVQSTTINENVKHLLNESQQQMEELRAQEEEMRQNMEELQAIQEQMSRQLEENTKIKTLLEARESVLAQTTILSESDLYGTITYVNPKFIEVSGYSSAELVGQGHNIVRHADMPGELFKLMWATIKSGKTFRGIIKNRKKDGGIYWVDAAIVPIFQNGKVIKYIGARYHIEDETIAEKMFARQMEKLRFEREVVMSN
jgi:PAS domain S-box-containing protein